jgi:hypothetical protein
MKENCVLASSNELRTICELAAVLVVVDAVVVLLALVEVAEEEVKLVEEDDDVLVDVGAANWIRLLSVRVTAFA